MRKLFLALIFSILIVFPSSVLADPPTVNIPPTNAYEKIITQNGTVEAPNFISAVKFVGDGHVTVTGSNGSQTIFFGSTPITPIGDRFGWFASDSSGSGGVKDQHFYNFSTGPGITATLGPDDFILSAINYVNASSIICPAGQAISSFDNSTGVLTCSPFIQTINGDPTAAQLVSGTTGHITVNDVGPIHRIDTAFKVNNQTCVGNSKFSSYDNVTGQFVCSGGTGAPFTSVQNIGHGGSGVLTHSGTILQGKNITSTDSHLLVSNNATDVNLSTSALLSSINGDTTAAQVIAAGQGITVSDAGATHTIKTNFKVNNITCPGSQKISTFDNSTGLFTCAGGTGAITSTQNIGHGAGSSGVLATPTSNLARGKNITTTSPLTNSNNNTDITIACPTCLTSGITSINSQTGPAYNIVGTTGNITITNSTNQGKINLGSNVVTTNGVDQTINKNLTLSSNQKITVNPSTQAGLNIGYVGAPTSLSNGDIFVSNSNLMLNWRANAVTRTAVDVGTSGQTITADKRLTGNNLFTGNNNFANGKVLIENPAKTFDTAIGNSAQYKNNTVGFPVILGTADTFGLLNATQSWLQINSYLSAGIRIFNPAATQFYSIQSSAITANRILTLPLTTQSETFAVQPQINFTSPANQTGTASVSGVMLGDGVTLTPTVTGRIEISVSGYVTSSVAADGCVLELRQGTGGSPANGAALTGTIRGSNMKITDAATTSRAPFSDNYMVSGLTVGTKVWAELGQKALTGGTCTVFNVNWTIKEL